jgi:hypothetical protein
MEFVPAVQERGGMDFGGGFTGIDEAQAGGVSWQEMLDAYNAGQRWREVIPEGVEVVSRGEDESAKRQRELREEEARRDRIRNTGQLPLFSRGKPATEVTLMREYEIEETGELVEVEENAANLLRQLDKRRGVVERLRECVRA